MDNSPLQPSKKFIDNLSSTVRWGLLVLASGLYVAAFLLLFPVLGPPLASISVIPVIMAGAFWGQAWGAIAGVISVALTFLLFNAQGTQTWQSFQTNGFFPGAVLAVLIGWLTGWMSDQRKNLRQQLVEKESIAKALRRRDDILDAVSYAARQFLHSAKWDQALSEALERIGTATEASHVYLVEGQQGADGQMTYRLHNEWCAEGCHSWMAAAIAAPEKFMPGFFSFESALRKGEALSGGVEMLSPEGQQALSEFGIRSAALVPIFSEKAWWGFIGLDDCISNRTWTSAEIEALETAADILGASRHARQSEEAERRERMLAQALRDTAAALSSSLDLQAVLDLILACAERVVSFDGINLMMIEDGMASTVRCRGYASRGLHDSFMSLHLPIEKLPHYRKMVETNTAECIPSTRLDPEWVTLPETTWIASYAGAPLIIKGETIGILNLDSSIEGYYTQEHAERLKALADQAAVAIENARLFAEIQQNTLHFKLLNEITHEALGASDLDEMMHEIAVNLLEMFHSEGVYLTLWNEKNSLTLPKAAAGHMADTYPFLRFDPGEMTITNRVLATGRVYIGENGPDAELVSSGKVEILGNRAVMGLPLITGSQKLGAAILSFPQPHHFTPSEITLGIQATGQLALAIAKAELLELGNTRIAQLTRANGMISALGRVAARIETAADPSGVISTLGEEISRLGLNCWVALQNTSDPSSMSIRYITLAQDVVEGINQWKGLGIEGIHLSPDGFGLYEQVISHRQTVFLETPQQVLGATFTQMTAEQIEQFITLSGTTSGTKGIYAPLTIEDQVIGLLLVWGENLLESETPAVSIFASQVAIAIQNTRLYAEVQKLALTDDLTGLSNRRELHELGQRQVEIAQRFGRPLSVLMLDIDHFKSVNDRYGHAVGDQALRVISTQLRSLVRDIDIVSRYGGEEFVIVLLENPLDLANQIGERIRQGIADTRIPYNHSGLQVTISVGIASLSAQTQTLDDLIELADQALYIAKQNGRNCVYTHSGNVSQ
jgi:diguanylate cyclase (GGDEF)-like protein